MDADAKDEGYKLPPDFQENTKEALVDFTVTDSTELWLIDLPKDQNPDFNGVELSLKLHNDGTLGSFEAPSGKEYEVVSSAAEQKATVFVSSASGTKIAGKISRRVSFVHYPEPSELKERLNSKRLKKMYQELPSGVLTQSSNNFATPTRSSVLRNSQSAGGRSASTHSSRPKSSIHSVGEQSQHRKKRHTPEPSRSMNRSSQNSGRGSAVSSLGQGNSGISSLGEGLSGATSSGQGHSASKSSGQGHHSKSRKKVKDEN
ncbi:hypothetical protein Prudu_001918 [Prunus dulcis]|uniref:Mediator-associated protein 2 n=1 Tax=Prunus dulcis TaxID=3755 RepID=A0A4Y1QPQ3_PRUDU|nr:hypothetical protein Prudu_001918 [Prunus dulcis]